jgi:hypothetical protein
MRLSETPDLTPNRRLIAIGLLITLGAWIVFALSEGDITKSLGDTDDAMRLVLARGLLNGQGWYDQLVTRLQPPVGIYMHWSRLLDGALAGFIWVVSRFTSEPWAELIVRFVWPQLWIAPAVIAGLSMARSLAGKVGVLTCAFLMFTTTVLYSQFRPGRIDHHDIQITMAAIAAACAMAKVSRPRFALAAGLASGLGLAIGIEALVYHAIIGAAFALSALVNPRDEARTARNYGLALAGSTVALFLIQTPPERWSIPVCDALGANLVWALGFAGVSLAVFGQWGWRARPASRVLQVAAIGVVAAAVYLTLDPGCMRGPFGSVDPRLRLIWFDHISELQPWDKLWRLHRDAALMSMVMAGMASAAALLLLVVRWRKWDRATLLAASLVFVACVAASRAWRMEDYAFWFGVPVLAAAIAWVAERGWRGLTVPTAIATLVLSPVPLAVAADAGIGFFAARAAAAKATNSTVKAHPGIDDHCFDNDVYRPLAALPPGVVLGEIDLGPFVLADTNDSVMAAPYHRMSWGIWQAYEALGGPTALAEPRLRAMNVTYVIDCRLNPLRVNPKGFEGDLRRGSLPPWLERLSTPAQPIQIYRVKAP